MKELEDILDEAIDIAEEASEIALSYFRQPLLIETKSNNTPVTVADKKTEEHMRKLLQQSFPGFGILGEELGEESAGAQFVWTIDPIDGTRSFVRGIPLWGTLLGLLEYGKPIAGVMILPGLDEAYWAAKGLGAFCNDQQIHVSGQHDLKASVIGAGDVYAFEETGTRKIYDKLIRETAICRGYTDCFGHSLVLRGSLDAMIDPLVSIWDIAPLAALITEAGGEYFDIHGNSDIRNSTFITCTPGLKADLLKVTH